jgi:Kelch motif
MRRLLNAASVSMLILVSLPTHSWGATSSHSGGSPGAWTLGGDMHEVRLSPARAVLNDGRVIVIGGFDDGFTAGNTVEIYDPIRDVWSYAAPVPRRHAGPGYAATLPDGTVLFAGGGVQNPDETWDLSEANLAFLFDPKGKTYLPDGRVLPGRWRQTGSLPGVGLSGPNTRAVVTAGTVVIASGQSDDSILAPDVPFWTASRHSYVYAIKSGKWHQVELNERRAHVPLVKLPDGRVFVSGGRQRFFDTAGNDIYSNTAEIYDPHEHAWKLVPKPMPSIPDEDGTGCVTPATSACPSLKPGSRWGQTQHVLRDGRVLVAGGAFSTEGNPFNVRRSVLIFDPRSGSWTRSRNDMPVGLFMPITSDLPDGRVLVAAGESAPFFLDEHRSWIFDPRNESWTPGPGMPCITLDAIVTEALGAPTGSTALPNESFNMQTGASQLPDGRVVFSGGFNNEVVDGTWGTTSQRTLVFDPRKAPTTSRRCPVSALPPNPNPA